MTTLIIPISAYGTNVHFTHETESPWPLHFKPSHGWKRQSRPKFASSHYAWGTNKVCMWMQDGYKVYMDSYMTSNGSCFMPTWTIFINRLLEVGLTQNWETMTLRSPYALINFILYACRPACLEIPWNNVWLRAQWPSHIRRHTTLEGLWPHYIHDM